MPKTVDEIRAIIKGTIESKLEKAEKSFNGLDARGNGDGKLSKADNEQAFMGLGKKYHFANDAEITLAEYKAAVASDALQKTLHIDTYDQDGEIGMIECSDFRRMIECELKEDLGNEDEGALLTILAAMNTSGKEGCAYTVFKTKLYELCSKPELYGNDEASTAFLKACHDKLESSEDQTVARTKTFADLDKSNNGVIDVKDFDDNSEITPEFISAIKKMQLGDKGEVSKDSFVSLNEYLLALTMGGWDKIMKKANGSLPETVTKDVFLKFLTEAGVSADAASVNTVYNKMPVAEYSVSIDDFNQGMAKFVTNQLLA